MCVTPSRVCELKSRSWIITGQLVSSHPHGCVSWNGYHTTTYQRWEVTPSRVCELKYSELVKEYREAISHTLTGVWVEIWYLSYTLTAFLGHTLTGVWVEIFTVYYITVSYESHPHGCVSWNYILPRKRLLPSRHTLTGVWVEIFKSAISLVHPQGHTLTGVWVEIYFKEAKESALQSHPHGCVSWNKYKKIRSLIDKVTPSRVCELKLYTSLGLLPDGFVTPSRVCELKFEISAALVIFSNVTPSRVCELKSVMIHTRKSNVVTPSRVCELKYL